MPVLSAKTQRSGFDALAARVEAKKREEKERELLDEALKKLTAKTIEKDIANDAKDREANLKFNVSLKSSAIENRQKQIQTEARNKKEASKNENEKKYDRLSIISGSQKIQELQEIQKQLNKSYEPKPLFEPRRPTMDSIKFAIEKDKQDEARRNKMVGTEGNDVVITTSDASTSVENIRKKKPKKKKTLDIVAANVAGVSATVNKTILYATQDRDKVVKDKDRTNKNKRGGHKTKKKIGIEMTVKTINDEEAPSWTDEQTSGMSSTD